MVITRFVWITNDDRGLREPSLFPIQCKRFKIIPCRHSLAWLDLNSNLLRRCVPCAHWLSLTSRVVQLTGWCVRLRYHGVVNIRGPTFTYPPQQNDGGKSVQASGAITAAVAVLRQHSIQLTVPEGATYHVSTCHVLFYRERGILRRAFRYRQYNVLPIVPCLNSNKIGQCLRQQQTTSKLCIFCRTCLVSRARQRKDHAYRSMLDNKLSLFLDFEIRT